MPTEPALWNTKAGAQGEVPEPMQSGAVLDPGCASRAQPRMARAQKVLSHVLVCQDFAQWEAASALPMLCHKQKWGDHAREETARADPKEERCGLPGRPFHLALPAPEGVLYVEGDDLGSRWLPAGC